MNRLTILLFIASFALLFGFSQAVNCTNTLFDICSVRSTQDYHIADSSYDYYLNVAGPLVGRSYGNCSTQTSGIMAIQQTKALNPNTSRPSRCWYLSRTDSQTFDFINSRNISQGTKVLYSQGQDNRMVQLYFPCDPNINQKPELVNVTEPNQKTYAFYFSPSKTGCPANPKVISYPSYDMNVSISAGSMNLFQINVPNYPMRSFSVQLILQTQGNLTISTTGFIKYDDAPTFDNYDQRRYLSRDNPSGFLNVSGHPNLAPGKYFVTLQGGPTDTVVTVRITSETCISCFGRGTPQCDVQTCNCRDSYIYSDCTGELKNLTLAHELSQQVLWGSLLKNVYSFYLPPGKVEIHAIVETNVSRSNTPLIYLTMNPYNPNPMSDPSTLLPIFQQQRSFRYKNVWGSPIPEGIYYVIASNYANRSSYPSRYSIIVNGYECPNNCAGSAGGLCNVTSHKCHCNPGRMQEDCSLESESMKINSHRDIRVAADSWLYAKFQGEQDLDLGCIDISVILKKKHGSKPDEMKSVILYLGDGFMPTKHHYFASSQRLEMDDKDIDNSTIIFGDDEDDEDEKGVISHNMQLCSVSYPGLVKKNQTFFLGVYNGDTKTHEMTVSVSRIAGKGVDGGVVFFLSLIMLAIGAVGCFLGMRYREDIVDYAKWGYEFVVTRGRSSGSSSRTAPASYATVSQDEEGLLGNNEDANEDIFE